ncbi:MAG: hypothetical protein KAH46_26555 [Mycobacterium sp.]|nr:hypothetical protein [Mycobacterium sp.]
MPIDKVGRSGLARVSIDRIGAFPTSHASDAELAHEALHRATGNVVALAAQTQPELPSAQHAPLPLPAAQHDRLPPLIGHLPR